MESAAELRHRPAREGRVACAVALLALWVGGCSGGPMVLQTQRPPETRPRQLDPAAVVLQGSALASNLVVDLRSLHQTLRSAVTALTLQALSGAPLALPRVNGGGDPSAARVEGARAELPKLGADAPEVWRPLDDRHQLGSRVWVDSARAEIRNKQVVVEARLRFTLAVSASQRGRARVLAACGCTGDLWCGGRDEGPRPATARWVLPVSLAPNWQLGAERAQFTLETPIRCNLKARGVAIDGAEQLLAPLVRSQDEIGEQLGRAIAHFDGFRAQVEPLWLGLAEPMLLGEDPTEAPALHVRPRAVEANRVEFSPSLALTRVRFAVNPVLGPFGHRPAEPVAWPPPADVGSADGFRVATELTVPAEVLQDTLAEAFVGRRYPDRTGRSVTIDGVRLFGSDGKVVVEIGLKGGGVTGSVYLTGRAQTLPTDSVLRFTDLAFTEDSVKHLQLLYDDLESSDLSVRRQYWVDPVQLAADIEEACGWSFKQALYRVREQIQAATHRAVTPNNNMWFVVRQASFLSAVPEGRLLRLLAVLDGYGGLEPADEPGSREAPPEGKGAPVTPDGSAPADASAQ